MSLKQAIREALTGNDVDVHSKMLALRKECAARGIHTDEVTRLVKVVIHEYSKPKAMPEPEAPQQEPTGLKANQEECKRGSLQGEELSRHHGQSYEPTTTRKDSDSMILRMADEKKGR